MKQTPSESRFFLVLGSEPPIPDPSWLMVEESVRNLRQGHAVSLVKADGTHIRADGARAMFTIVFYETADSPPLVIGRRDGGHRRGKAALMNNRVLVSRREWWSADGIAIFRAFHEGQPLADAFELRDSRTEYSDEEIRAFLQG